MQVSLCSIGIDVSAEWLDICNDDQQVIRISNSKPKIAKWLSSVPDGALIAMEATGRYHLDLAELAHLAQHPVYVLNPRDVHHYARGIGRRAKTDKADARVIHRMLRREYSELRIWHPPTPEQALVNKLYKRRAKLVELRQAFVMMSRDLPELAAEIEAQQAAQNALIKAIDKHIQAIINRDQQTREAAKRLQTLDGIGPLNANYLSNLFSYGQFQSSDQVVSFIGLDLCFADSGKKTGRRRLSKRGPGECRRLLFNAARAAARGRFKQMHEALKQRMSEVQATIALMRKMVKIAFAIWKHEQEFDISRYKSPLMQG